MKVSPETGDLVKGKGVKKTPAATYNQTVAELREQDAHPLSYPPGPKFCENVQTQIKASDIHGMEIFFCNAVRGIISTTAPSYFLRNLIEICDQEILQRIST